VTGVSPAVIDAVGTGGAANPLMRVSGTALTGSDGKPEVFYLGAEWCPYCAAERWAMVVALSHFGSFKNLRLTTSTSGDVPPDINTLSFYGSSFTSTYVDFVPVELEDRNRNPLETPTAQEQQLAQTYDRDNGIPFIDIGNVYTMIGQGVPPAALQGMSWQQIAAALSNASSPVTRAIVGNANYLTAAICTLPGASAAPICSDSVIKQTGSQLPH
jgi:thiol-disulfide isomerase/thioredoxin